MKDTFRRSIDWDHGYAFQKYGPSVRRKVEETFFPAQASIVVNVAIQLCLRAELEAVPKEKCGNA
jgi:hypothetical protein